MNTGRLLGILTFASLALTSAVLAQAGGPPPSAPAAAPAPAAVNPLPDPGTLADLATIVSGVLTSLAIVVGGIWAFYRFRAQREYATNPQVSITHEALPYSADLRLMVFTVRIRNIGKTLVNARRIRFALRKLPGDAAAGQALHWRDGESFLEGFDVIKGSNPEDSTGIYRLEPGDQYDELVPVVVPRDALMIASVEFLGEEREHLWVYSVARA